MTHPHRKTDNLALGVSICSLVFAAGAFVLIAAHLALRTPPPCGSEGSPAPVRHLDV